MEINKICTSIEQSKKLIELGIDVSTADMFWKNGVSNQYIQCFTPFVSNGTNIDFDYDIPAWSLSALLELMPNFNMFKRTIECKIETINHLIDKACDPIDAAFEMVVWLKKNKKL